MSMLENEKYKGDALLQKSYTVDFLTKKRTQNKGEIQMFYVEDIILLIYFMKEIMF